MIRLCNICFVRTYHCFTLPVGVVFLEDLELGSTRELYG